MNANLRIPLEVVAGAALLFGLSAVALNWNALPETVPIHFNLFGQPDGYGSKMVLLFVAAVSALMYALLFFGQLNPQRSNVPWKVTEENRKENERLVSTLLLVMKLETSVFLGFLQWAMVAIALGQRSDIGSWPTFAFIIAVFSTLALFFIHGSKMAKKTT